MVLCQWSVVRCTRIDRAHGIKKPGIQEITDNGQLTTDRKSINHVDAEES